jgi:hypothetical protein
MDSDVLLIRTDAWGWLHQNKPRFVLTDATNEVITPLNKFCETNNLICINASSRLWLTGMKDGQKRSEPFEAIIAAFPDEAIICDPFMGWGTTGIAALRQGRKFIGIEQRLDRIEYAFNAIQHENASASLHTEGF